MEDYKNKYENLLSTISNISKTEEVRPFLLEKLIEEHGIEKMNVLYDGKLSDNKDLFTEDEINEIIKDKDAYISRILNKTKEKSLLVYPNRIKLINLLADIKLKDKKIFDIVKK